MRLTRRRLLAGAAFAACCPAAARAAVLEREEAAAAGRAEPSPAPPARPPYPPLPPGVRPFAAGETLRYSVDYQGLRAGDATLAVVGQTAIEDLSGLLVRYTGETRGLVAKVYRLQDRIESLLDPLFLFTRRTETWSRQRDRYRHRIVTFDAKAGRFVRREIPGDTVTGPLETPVVEGLGLVYHLRVKPLEPGTRLTVPIYRRQGVTFVTFGASGPVVVETPAGRFETVEVKPVATNGAGHDEGGLFGGHGSMWFTTDARRVPVRLVGSAAVGSIEARLSGIDLPEPLTDR